MKARQRVSAVGARSPGSQVDADPRSPSAEEVGVAGYGARERADTTAVAVDVDDLYDGLGMGVPPTT